MSERYKNKYFSLLGDSISTYEGYLPQDYPSYYSHRDSYVTNIYGSRDTWWGQVIQHFKARLLVNNSFSGSYVCRAKNCETQSYGCSDLRTSCLSQSGIMPDVIIVFLGTNDRGAGFALTSEDKSDLSVIENAYAAMLDKIKKNYKEAEIWCCTFPKTTCSRNPYFVFPESQMGVPMESYGELVKKLAREKGVNVIDLWDSEALCDTVDNLHPNYDGMKYIAEKVIFAMESFDGCTDVNTRKL